MAVTAVLYIEQHHSSSWGMTGGLPISTVSRACQRAWWIVVAGVALIKENNT
jgi:hypothetical protein